MEIRIGVPVVAEDGEAGRVSRVVLDPETTQVVGIVAEEAGMLPHDVVIPVSAVLNASDDAVCVSGTLDDVSQYPPFTLSQYVTPPADWMPPTDLSLPASVYLFPESPYLVGAFHRPATQADPSVVETEAVGAGEIEVSGSTAVYCRDGAAGYIESVVTEGETDQVSHLIVRRANVGERDVLVPVSEVESVGDDVVYLAMDRNDLDMQPTFDPDEEEHAEMEVPSGLERIP
jgi:uncharacterized protein YrrD